MMLVIEGTQWAKKVPTKLPIYNIAGDQDPVGEYGLGVCQVSNWLVETGHHILAIVTKFIIMQKSKMKWKPESLNL